MSGSELQRQEGIGLSCMKSFNRLATCTDMAIEKVKDMDIGAEANNLVRRGAEAVGLTSFDPLESAREGIVGKALEENRRRIDSPGM